MVYHIFMINADRLVAKIIKRVEDMAVLERTAQSTLNNVSYSTNLSMVEAEVLMCSVS